MNKELTLTELVDKKRTLDKEIRKLINDFQKETGLGFDSISTNEFDIKCYPYKSVYITTSWDLDKLI